MSSFSFGFRIFKKKKKDKVSRFNLEEKSYFLKLIVKAVYIFYLLFMYVFLI